MEGTAKTISTFTRLLLGASFLLSTSAFAQEDDLPTLKLDRIPAQPAFAGQTRAPAAKPSSYEVETVVSGLTQPWALAFLPGGEILINEYVGDMRIVDSKRHLSEPIRGLPEMSHKGWAGLFDVTLDPEFAHNQRVYFSYTAPPEVPDGPNVSRVARARLVRDELRLTEVEVIVDGFGGQELHFLPDGTLLVSGAGDSSKDDPQDLSSTLGKLLRVRPDGSTPEDNPFYGKPKARPEIYTYGHRDISGMATHPETGEIWITEHGPRGGDELNLIHPGANYGWKVISYGTEYSGKPIGSGLSAMEGMEQPRYFWLPSIATSGLIFYEGAMFPEWRGNVFVTALSGQHISRLVMDGERIVAEERMLVDRAQRIRELRVGPDGALYALTNEEENAAKASAELLRISRPVN
jgi:glucose/arabinose dehydrogenase